MTDLERAFRDAFRCHPAGVALITAFPGGAPVAMTVSSLISVSAEPPTLAFSLSSRSGATPGVLAAGRVAVHLLRHADLALAQLGATPGADRFALPWEPLPDGTPRFTQVKTWFHGRISGRLEVPGATLVTVELLAGEAPGSMPDHEALIYLDRRWHRLRAGAEGAPLDLEDRDVFR